MARWLMTSILLHQTLHGYSDGHRLIAGSLPLDPSDARIMLVMSDLSGPGVKPPRGGYLTGYPLEKSGKYVLARTWSAPEMPRPGCVWTHSLIIEYADVAAMVSVRSLLDAFKRPQGNDAKAVYGVLPVLLSPDPVRVEPSIRLETLLESLYAFPDRPILAETSDCEDDEKLVTAIWMQQWPRLRRSFGFCTLTAIDRSTKAVALDLQLMADRQLVSKFPNAMLAQESNLSAALHPLLLDLAQPAKSTLREFLKRAGGDVDGGRRAMSPLCELHTSLFGNISPDLPAAIHALGELDAGGRRQARSMRTEVAKQALEIANEVDDEVFDFLLETFEQSSVLAGNPTTSDKLGIALWRRSPRRFHSALNSISPLRDVAEHALSQIPKDLLVAGLRTHSEMAIEIVPVRPDILLEPMFWTIAEIEDGVVELIPESAFGEAAEALLAAGRTGPATYIIERIDPVELARALESPKADRGAMLAWLDRLCCYANRLAAVLATGKISRLTMLVAIARRIYPDDVPNAYGEDPWLTALQGTSGSFEQSEEDFLAAFLLSRALGRETKSAAQLLRFAYTRAHMAFRDQRFSYEAERLARGRLSSDSWFEWDNCTRLRETVVHRFVDHDLDPETFGRLTDDGPLSLALFDEAARTRKGRKYLEKVHRALRSTTGKGMKARADHIARKLK
jgi:hypothetical protein